MRLVMTGAFRASHFAVGFGASGWIVNFFSQLVDRMSPRLVRIATFAVYVPGVVTSKTVDEVVAFVGTRC